MSTFEHFHKKHKKLYILFLLFFALTIGSAIFAFSKPQIDKKEAATPQNIEEKLEAAENIQKAELPAKKVDPGKSDTLPVHEDYQNTKTIIENDAEKNTTSTTTENETAIKKSETNVKDTKSDSKQNNESVSATLKVSGKSYGIEIPKDSTVLDLMNVAKAKGYMTFESKNFGGDLGYFIESINGVESGETKNYYWIYYINGAKANAGISNYTIQQNDIITWNYEKSTL